MLENLKLMHTASLTTTVMEVSPHRNFARGQVGIEELIDALFDRPKCIIPFQVRPSHHMCACGFFKLKRRLMHDWDLMLSELFLFHRQENRG